MKIAITGTRSGWTLGQEAKVRELLMEFRNCSELHHGDCIGVDSQVSWLAKELGYKIICHPGPDDQNRAWVPADETRPRFTHFRRNRNLVQECDKLLVLPYQSHHDTQGGTWYTYDYAIKLKKLTYVIFPNGNLIVVQDGTQADLVLKNGK
jgi:hypothetical protein